MYFGNPDVIAPVFGCLMIVAIVVGPAWIRSYYRSKEREQLHATLRAAYEQGQTPPPELLDKLAGRGDADFPIRGTPDNDLRRAVVLIAVGLGLGLLGFLLGWGITRASDTGGWIAGGAIAGAGAIPGMIGLAYLFLWMATRRGPRS
jgi:hypothetical protein